MTAVSDAVVVGIRQQVRIPLAVAGREVPAEFVSFTGNEREDIAIVFAPIGPTPVVRLHSECLTGDRFGSLRCDCGAQLDEAIATLADEGGVLLYLRQEGRGIGLYAKLEAYALQDEFGVDTFTANELLGRAADERSYAIAAGMLSALCIQKVELLTNNPDKAAQLQANGIDVAALRPTRAYATSHNRAYLRAKREWAARLA